MGSPANVKSALAALRRGRQNKEKETMKKLMIAAAIVCAAAFANAASANWYAGYINDVDGNPLGSSSTGYTAVFNVYSDAALSTLVTSASSSDWDSGLAMGSTADVLDNATDTTYYGQIIVTHGTDTLKSDGFQFTTSSYFDEIDVAIMTAPDEISGLEKIGGGAFDGTNGAFETNGGGTWNVPEPTSGLLLLLGVAGLALRRKQA